MTGRFDGLIAKTKQQVMDNITSRNLLPGSRTPTVREWSKILGVSHVTAAKAIHELVVENKLVSRNKAGTFVSGSVNGRNNSRETAKNSGNLYLFWPEPNQIKPLAYHDEIIFTLQQQTENRGWNLRNRIYNDNTLQEAVDDPDILAIIAPITVPIQYPRSIPIITYGMKPSPPFDVPTVTPDNYRAGYDAGKFYLQHCDCSATYFIGAPKINYLALFSEERYRGICDSFYLCNRQPPTLLYWNLPENIINDIRNLFDQLRKNRPDKPIMLFIANRKMAAEISIFLLSYHLKTPDDVNIITFIRDSNFHSDIPLDTFDFDHKEMGLTLIELVTLATEGKQLASRLLLPMSLFREGST